MVNKTVNIGTEDGELRLFVNVAAMGNPRYIDGLGRVVNFIHGAVIAYSDSPLVVATFELFAARRPGGNSQTFAVRQNSDHHLEGNLCSSFSALSLSATR